VVGHGFEFDSVLHSDVGMWLFIQEEEEKKHTRTEKQLDCVKVGKQKMEYFGP